VGEEIVSWIGRNNLGVTLIKKGESAASRADVNRLPEAIKHEDLTV
jgi:hypothetical protein